MNWLIANWVPMYLFISPFVAVLAAADAGYRQNPIIAVIWGLFWPLWIIMVAFYFLLHVGR